MHCCACSGVCAHVSPPSFCPQHAPVPAHCCGCGRTAAPTTGLVTTDRTIRLNSLAPHQLAAMLASAG